MSRSISLSDLAARLVALLFDLHLPVGGGGALHMDFFAHVLPYGHPLLRFAISSPVLRSDTTTVTSQEWQKRNPSAWCEGCVGGVFVDCRRCPPQRRRPRPPLGTPP